MTDRYMIDLTDSLIGLDLWAVEHCQHHEDTGGYPFHGGELEKALEGSMRDIHYNNRGLNKWQLVFIGTEQECHTRHEDMWKREHKRLEKAQENE